MKFTPPDLPRIINQADLAAQLNAIMALTGNNPPLSGESVIRYIATLNGIEIVEESQLNVRLVLEDCQSAKRLMIDS